MKRDDLDHLADQAAPITPKRNKRHIAPYEPFPIDVLPEPVGSFVRVASGAIGCDPSFVALPLLAVLASLIGNSRRICLKTGWVEPPVLWIGLVGDSGTMKSPGFRAAMNAIYVLQQDEMKAATDRWQQYEQDVARFELATREWKKNPAGDAPTRPPEPQPKRLVVSDTTVEAIAQILADNWRGLLLQRDELGGWISSFDRYARGRGNSDVAHWLSMYNATSIFVDRKTGNRQFIFVEHSAVCIAGGIQPQTLRRTIGTQHRENGLLARFVFAWPPRPLKRWSDRGIPPSAEAEIGLLCDGLRNLQPNRVGEDKLEPVQVRFDPEAQQLWRSFFDEHGREQHNLSGDLAAAWSKLEALPARLALIFHCIRQVSDDSTLKSHEFVDVASLAPAIELTRWFGREIRRVYAMLDEDVEQSHHRQLVETIQRMGGTVSLRDWYRARSKSRDDARTELQELEEAGYGHLHYQSQNGSGRPSEVFSLHSEDGDDDSDTDKTTDSESPAGVSSVSESTTAPNSIRSLIAQLLIALRRQGHVEEAISIRDAWHERLAGGVIEHELDEQASEAFAFDAIASMFRDDPHFARLGMNGHVMSAIDRRSSA